MLLFTETGQVFWLRVYENSRRKQNGQRPGHQNSQLSRRDKIRAVINIHDLKNPDYVINSVFFLYRVNFPLKRQMCPVRG